MEPLTIRHEIEVEAPIERVWYFVATEEGRRRWDSTSHGPWHLDHLVFEARPAGRFEARGLHEGKPYRIVGRVLTSDPPHRIVMTWREDLGGGALWPEDTVVSITLEARDGRTHVVIEHAGFERLPVGYRARVAQAYEAGWKLAGPALPNAVAAHTRRELSILKEIEIDAPPDRVWPYIATQEGCARWLCTAAEHYTLVLEEREGGRYEEHFVYQDRPYHAVGTILTYDPPQRIVFTHRELESRTEPWPVETTIAITLTDLGGRTRITLEHSGFDALPDGTRGFEFYQYGQGWSVALEDLLAIVIKDLLPALGQLAVYKSIEVEAPAERVWWFIGTEEGTRARHRAESTPEHRYDDETLEPRQGGRYELRGVYAGEPFRITGRVLAYEPPRRLVLTWREDGWPADTVVTFRLTEYSGKTRVTVIHSGFERLPAERRERVMMEYAVGRERGIEILRTLLSSAEARV